MTPASPSGESEQGQVSAVGALRPRAPRPRQGSLRRQMTTQASQHTQQTEAGGSLQGWDGPCLSGAGFRVRVRE